jgi:hypothetical protein
LGTREEGGVITGVESEVGKRHCFGLHERSRILCTAAFKRRLEGRPGTGRKGFLAFPDREGAEPFRDRTDRLNGGPQRRYLSLIPTYVAELLTMKYDMKSRRGRK